VKLALVPSSELSSHDLRASTYVEKSCEAPATKTRRSSAGKSSRMNTDSDTGPSTTDTRQGFTFTPDEVHAMSQLFAVLYRGGDVRVMVRSKTVSKLASKFNARAAKLRAAAPVKSDLLVDILR